MKNREILGLLAAGLLVATPMRSASAVTVSPGQSVVFNFYLPRPGGPPWAPLLWDDVRLWPRLSDFHSPMGPMFEGECFEGLNATGGSTLDCYHQLYTYLFEPGYTDGIFSWRLTSWPTNTETFSANPCATGEMFFDGPGSGCIAGTLTSAPEPGTLALLGLGLAGLGFTRRRKA